MCATRSLEPAWGILLPKESLVARLTIRHCQDLLPRKLLQASELFGLQESTRFRTRGPSLTRARLVGGWRHHVSRACAFAVAKWSFAFVSARGAHVRRSLFGFQDRAISRVAGSRTSERLVAALLWFVPAGHEN
jgi:hypothetical protein